MAASVEAVILATETPTHADLAAQALEAGKHVFVEKPLAQTTEDAARLVALAEVQGRRLMVGHLLRYHPAYRHVERLVREGTLGAIRYLYSVRVNLGIVRETESAFDSLAPHDLAVARGHLARDKDEIPAAHGLGKGAFLPACLCVGGIETGDPGNGHVEGSTKLIFFFLS